MIGRPQQYKKEFVEMSRKYIEDVEIPFVEELCGSILNISCDSLYDYVKDADKKDFSDTIKRLKEKQALAYQKLGLTGKVNPTMAIFLLKCNHGYIETNKVETDGNLSINIVTSKPQ